MFVVPSSSGSKSRSLRFAPAVADTCESAGEAAPDRSARDPPGAEAFRRADCRPVEDAVFLVGGGRMLLLLRVPATDGGRDMADGFLRSMLELRDWSMLYRRVEVAKSGRKLGQRRDENRKDAK